MTRIYENPNLPRKDDAKAGGGASSGGKPAYPGYLTVEKPPYRPGVKRVPVDRYYKQEYHDLEVEKIWKKAWQWACREEDIPEVGDYFVYEVADLSFIVVRTGPDEIKAYWNSCLHRGRKLKEFNGKRATEFRCMFHGWSWDINGAMNDMTCGWDFPGTRAEVGHLPEAKTGVWGGFVFINPDPDCEPLAEFLGELPDHFEKGGHDFSKRWKQVHVVAELPVNWKVAQEAFIESWHVSYTHPQLLRPKGREPVGTRWDNFGNWMRGTAALPTDEFKSPAGTTPPAETDQQVLNQFWDFHLNETPGVAAEPGVDAMETIFKRSRDLHRDIIGEVVDNYHDSQFMGGEMVHIWPNFHPWGGLSRLVYRFRPSKNDPDRCLMDIALMAPWPEDRPRPPPAAIRQIGLDEQIIDAEELGQLGRIFLQDIANMLPVQSGLKTSRQGYIILSSHNEAPVRHVHDLYEKWMGLEPEVEVSDEK